MIRRSEPLKRSTKPLKRTRIKPVSDKQRKSNAELAALKPALIERSGGYCEVRLSPHCTGVGTAGHHILKQSQTDDHDIDLIAWSCWPCNDYVEVHADEAEAAGMLIKSWDKPKRKAAQ